MTHCLSAVPDCLWVASAGGAESIILSAGGTERMMLSAGSTESMMPSDTLRAGAESAESIILSMSPTESMILSVLFGRVITLTATAMTKKQQQLAILTIAD
jgi:hypothetical protein